MEPNKLENKIIELYILFNSIINLINFLYFIYEKDFLLL